MYFLWSMSFWSQGQLSPLPPAMAKDAGQSQYVLCFPNEHANNQIFFTGFL